jgi:hypothetical protein
MIRHNPPPLPQPHRDSSWPIVRRWLEAILLPTITAALIAGLATIIAMREDVAVMKLQLQSTATSGDVAVMNQRLSMIERRLDKALP